MDASNDKKYFLCLDGFRAICVCWVVVLHLASTYPLFSYPLNSFSKIVMRFCELGYLGVDVFFVISGFLIAGLLIEEITGNIRLRRFYVRRAFKILPQYFLVVCAGIMLTLAYSSQKYDLLSYVSCFLMVQNYFPSLLIFWHLWSIAVEEHFYLFLPLLFWLICRSSSVGTERKRRIIFALILLIILGNWIRAVSLQGLTPEAVHNARLWQQSHVIFDALIFGCLIRAIHAFTDVELRYGRNLRKWLFLVGALLAIYLFCGIDAVKWLDYTLVYVSAGCLIFSGVLGFQPLVMVMESPIFKWIGRNSYGIYLWHFPMLCVSKMWLGVLRNEWLVLIYLLLTFILGVGLTQTVEKKFLNIRRQLFP